MYVLRNQKTPEAQQMREKSQLFFTAMNIAYGLMIPMSVIPVTAPVCNSLNIYPTTMFACNILFLANAAFFFYAKFNHFWIQENADKLKEKLIDDEVNVEQERDMLRAQCSSYGNYLMILSVVQVAIILLGKIYIDEGEYLACTGGGYQWVYTSISGSAFALTVMVTIMMQSVMIEKFLYRIPNKFGMFESIKVKPVAERMGDAFAEKFKAFHVEVPSTAVN